MASVNILAAINYNKVSKVRKYVAIMLFLTYHQYIIDLISVEASMRIIDIPEFKDRKKLLTIDLETPLIDAAKKMKEMNYGSAIVVDKSKNDKLCGIFTERDLLMKVAGEGKEMKKLKLKDVMTSKVKTTHYNETVEESIRRMSQGRFRHLPVVDDDGNLVGMVSQGDFVALTWYQLMNQLKTHTVSSMSSYTQVWMLIVPLVIYLGTILYFITK